MDSNNPNWEKLKEEIMSKMTEEQREIVRLLEIKLRLLEIKFQKETEELKKRLEETDE